jgi:hypothetical protein
MAGSVLTYLDGYCERAGDAALWAEPLNAVTNLFFILAAVLAARTLLKTGHGRRIDCWLLVVALFAIGIGSGIWHLHPTGATVLMDVIPITLFIHIYLVTSMRHLLGFSWRKALFWWFAYLSVSIAAQLNLSPHLLNGTIMYIPTYVTLLVLTAAVRARDPMAGRIFIQMVLVWTASLIFRTIDLAICPSFPLGTHFLWHTLNAYMLYRLLMVLISKPEKSAI